MADHYQVVCDDSDECESGSGKEDDNLSSFVLRTHSSKSNRSVSKLIQLVIILLILTREIINQQTGSHHQGSSSAALSRYARSSCRPLIALVAAENDEQYAEASSDSPSVDSLDDDEDNEELDSSASNEYPDGENDNDESYDDAEDDRQESRTHNRWLHPGTAAPTRNYMLN